MQFKLTVSSEKVPSLVTGHQQSQLLCGHLATALWAFGLFNEEEVEDTLSNGFFSCLMDLGWFCTYRFNSA